MTDTPTGRCSYHAVLPAEEGEDCADCKQPTGTLTKSPVERSRFQCDGDRSEKHRGPVVSGTTGQIETGTLKDEHLRAALDAHLVEDTTGTCHMIVMGEPGPRISYLCCDDACRRIEAIVRKDCAEQLHEQQVVFYRKGHEMEERVRKDERERMRSELDAALTEHCQYEGAGDYKTGTADGHRCARAKADAILRGEEGK